MLIYLKRKKVYTELSHECWESVSVAENPRSSISLTYIFLLLVLFSCYGNAYGFIIHTYLHICNFMHMFFRAIVLKIFLLKQSINYKEG